MTGQHPKAATLVAAHNRQKYRDKQLGILRLRPLDEYLMREEEARLTRAINAAFRVGGSR
jgi:hypothetical protein